MEKTFVISSYTSDILVSLS